MSAPDDVVAIVERTREEQGLPLRIEDPVVLGRVARIFLERGEAPALDRDPVSPDHDARSTAQAHRTERRRAAGASRGRRG